MSLRRIHTLLLASAGVLLGHMVGYAAAHPGTAQHELALGAHRYLGSLAAIVMPLGLVAMLAIAVRSVRTQGVELPSAAELVSAQVCLFVAQELLERVPGSASPMTAVGDRAVWFGAVAQVVIAVAVAWLVRYTARALSRVLGASKRRPAAVSATVPRPFGRSRDLISILERLPRRRGPPRRCIPMPI